MAGNKELKFDSEKAPVKFGLDLTKYNPFKIICPACTECIMQMCGGCLFLFLFFTPKLVRYFGKDGCIEIHEWPVAK